MKFRFMRLPVNNFNSTLICKAIIVLVILGNSLFLGISNAQITTIVSNEYIKDQDWFPPGIDNTIQVGDPEALTGSAYVFNDKQVNNYVKLYIDHSKRNYFTSDKSYRVVFQLKYWTYSIPFDPDTPPLLALLTEHTETKELTVNYDADFSHDFKDIAEYRFSNAYKVRVAITAVYINGGSAVTSTTNIPTGLAMELGIEEERYYKLESTDIADHMQIAWDDDYKELVIKNFNIDGAINYDVEWTYVNDYSFADVDDPLAPEDLEFAFHNNSSRITVNSNKSIRIPATFDRGYVVCRVRGIGIDVYDTGFKKKITTDWNVPDNYDGGDAAFYHLDEIDLPDGSPIIQIGTVGHPAHEANKNWMYQVSFAEEGKMKHSITYYDGSMRARQTIALANTEKEVIVGETFYDYQGRPVAQSLPVPPDHLGDGSGDRIFKYRENFNQNETGDKFSRADFATDDPDFDCDALIGKFNTESGTGRYYSADNPLKTEYNAFIPDAAGYGYSLVEYTPDGSGRVSKQSSPGEAFAMDGDHVSTYLYGTPFQDELDRLFGTNVGFASHYQKNAVIDANGQASVSYIDMKGHVIATGLAGEGAPNTAQIINDDTEDPLYEEAATTNTIDLLDQSEYDLQGAKNALSADGKTLTLSVPIIVTTESDYVFSYTLDGLSYMDDCLEDQCLTCVYDLNIQLLDHCGNVVEDAEGGEPLSFSLTVGDVPLPDGTDGSLDCEDENSFNSEDYLAIFTIEDLPVGVYTLTKTLTINQQALDTYSQLYFDNTPACHQDYDDFNDEAVEGITEDDCEIDCAYCSTLTWESYYEANASTIPAPADEFAGLLASYNDLVLTCQQVCTMPTNDFCGLGYDMMIQDVSPGGQYAEYLDPETGLENASLFPVSILNADNILPYKTLDGVSKEPGWKSPFKFNPASDEWLEGYYDEDGLTRSKIYLDQNDEGDWLPEHFLKHTDDGGLTYYCYPEDLKHVNDFVNYFKLNPSWANSIVCYHPEWYYYEHCSKLYEAKTTDPIDDTYYDPFQFDVYLYDHAYVDDTWEDYLHPEDVDPFFHELIDEDIDLDESAMTAKLDAFYVCDTYTFSALQFAWLQTHIGNEIYGQDCAYLNALLPTVGSDADYITDYNTWLAFLGIYTGIKHEIWQAAANIYSDANKSYNGCIGEPEYNFDYSLLPIEDEVADFGALLGGTYTCAVPSGLFLIDKTARYGDIHNLFDLGADADADAINAAAEEAEDEADVAYFDATGNPAMAFDLENFIKGWLPIGLEPVSTVPITDNDLLTMRLWETLDGLGAGFTDWDATFNVGHTILTWDPAGTPGTPCLQLTIASGTFDDVIGFSDIHVTGATTFTINAIIPDLLGLPGATLDVVVTGESNCIPIGDYSAIYSTCDLTPEGSALWTIMNLELSESEFFNTTGDEIDESPSFSYYLKDYIGEGTTANPYVWMKEDDDLFRLSSNDGTRYIQIHCNTDVSATDAEYIDQFYGHALPDYTGPNSNFEMHIQTNEQIDNGFIDWHWGAKTYSFPVSDCDYSTELTCNDEEHYNRDDLEAFIAAIVDAGGLTLSTGDYIDLSTIPEYTDRLELLTGSPVTTERWHVIENSDAIYQATISTFEDDVYTDNCTITLTINNPEVSDAFDFEDAVSASNLVADYTDAFGSESAYDFIIDLTTAGPSTYSINGTSCIPLKNCSPCSEAVESSPIAGGYVHINITLDGDDYFDVEVSSVDAPTESGTPGHLDDKNLTVIVETPSTTYTYEYEIDDPGSWEFDGYFLSNTFAPLVYSEVYVPDGTTDDIGVITIVLGDPESVPEINTLEAECYPDFTIPNLPEVTYESDCYEDMLAAASSSALENYNEYYINSHTEFEQAYIAKCMTAATTALETFTMTYNSAEYQFTLYYYDQAGNLVATVPPEGVDLVDPGDFDAIDAYRKEISVITVPVPDHYESLYAFNSLNQLTWQETPDAGESKFLYDGLGRIVLSQNAEQVAHPVDGDVQYSYSRYDKLGRVFEVGQVTGPENIEGNAYYSDWVNDMDNFPMNFGSNREQVTLSIYDAAQDLTVDPPFGTDGQQNLKKRIASVFYFDAYDGDIEDYDHATHYSYDIHGNVHTLIQDNPTIASLGEQFKKMEYDYDLVSGNVNAVTYQKGDVDQFFHEYKYDADNRLVKVRTSYDSYIWDLDAYYRYYRHGPLARVEVGDLKVQGIDYAYTLNGWLKGVNAGALNNTRDMGKDAKTGTNPNQYVAADAFGFILHYFDGDYTQIDNSVNDFVPAYSGSDFYNASPDLFNGNIKAMVTALRKGDGSVEKVLGKAYNYDQLNRIHNSKSFEAADMHSTGMFTWNTTGRGEVYKWETSYEYDGNGNITQMNRAGNNATTDFDMDKFVYHYGTNNNQLQYVSDNTSLSGNYSVDIDNQTSSTNYEYDAIGNLVEDESVGITDIDWTVYGKIKTITKTSGPNITFAYDAMGNRIMKKVAPTTGAVTYTYYVCDGQGNIMATYKRVVSGTDVISLTEQHIYGSARLGYRQREIAMTTTLPTDGYYYRYLGEKRYEMTNHLGNVLAVITDRRKGEELTGDAIADRFLPDVIAYSDYDPYGMLLNGRNWVSANGYRFGFNNKEKDDETYGNGCEYDYGFRIYDPRLGRFLSVDPLSLSYPWVTPYQFAFNRPIVAIDLDGLEAEDDNSGTANSGVGSDPNEKTDELINDISPVEEIDNNVAPIVDVTKVLNLPSSSPANDNSNTTTSAPNIFIAGIGTLQVNLKTMNYNLYFTDGGKILPKNLVKTSGDGKFFTIPNYPGSYSTSNDILKSPLKFVDQVGLLSDISIILYDGSKWVDAGIANDVELQKQYKQMVMIDGTGAVIGFLSPEVGLIMFVLQGTVGDVDRNRDYLQSLYIGYDHHKSDANHVGTETWCDKCMYYKNGIYSTREKLDPGCHLREQLLYGYPVLKQAK